MISLLDKKVKDDNIRVRCTKDFKIMAERLAAKENRTLSNYIENLILKDAEKEK